MFGFGPIATRPVAWSGTCQVCARWPAQPVCPACEERFAAPRRRCRQCAAVLAHAGDVCGACQTRREPGVLQQCVAVVDYNYPWDGLIARFKFRHEPGWAGPFADLMLHRPEVRALLGSCSALVPVPVTPARLAQRGYNQAWELASALRQRSQPQAPPAMTEALVRVRETADQHVLPREKRLHNLRGVFAAHPRQVPGLVQAHVLLVDDVTTTGATLQAAAQALLEAGAAAVSALVLAHTPLE